MADTKKDSNVNTNLSSPDLNPTNLDSKESVFYYSRENRLNRASPEVRALNDGNFARPSLAKVMFGSRANKILIFSVIVICVIGLAIHYLTRESSPATTMVLGGNTLSLAILRIEETLILVLIKDTPDSGEFYTGEVEIAVSPAAPRADEAEAFEEPQVFTHRVSFRPVVSETFHISLPFEGDDFFAVLRAGDEQRSMRLRAVETD
jgi:hypothetical protein